MSCWSDKSCVDKEAFYQVGISVALKIVILEDIWTFSAFCIAKVLVTDTS